MKKHFLSVLCMLLVLACLLCACGKGSKDADAMDEDKVYAIPAGKDKDDTKPAEDKDDTVKPAGEGSILGELVDGVYTNEYVGVKASFPSDWTVQEASQLQALSEAIEEQLDKTNFGSAVEGLAQATVLMATDPAGNNVNILLQNNKSTAMLKNFTEEQIIDSQVAMKDQLIKAYSQMGIEVSDIQKVTVNYLGEKHYALYTESTISGVPMYTLQIMNYSKGDYAVIITATSFFSDSTQELMEYFQPLNES